MYALICTGSRLGFLPVIALDICYRVLAHDLYQNVVSAQYLESKWVEIHHILHMHL